MQKPYKKLIIFTFWMYLLQCGSSSKIQARYSVANIIETEHMKFILPENQPKESDNKL